jgi:hypothetical protein
MQCLDDLDHIIRLKAERYGVFAIRKAFADLWVIIKR